MSGMNTNNGDALIRAELWSRELKDALEDELMANRYVKWLTEFPDGTTFTIPSIGDLPSLTVGFSLPTIPNLSLPRLAEGGIVKRQPGGIIANIGEGRYDEAVVPLKPGMKMGSTYNITVNAGMGSDGKRIGEQIIQEIKRFERQSGPVFARA